MNTAENSVVPSVTWKASLRAVVQVLGSLKLTIVLLATMVTVLVIAALLEANQGRDYAQWYVYHRPWFVGLLTLFAVNSFFAAAGRWPWTRRQAGLVITHCGLLALLIGFIQAVSGSSEGQVKLEEGQTTSKMIIPQQSQITVSWTGQPAEAPYEFVFEPGPVDWREGKTLNLGEVDGIRARVLRYYRHARVVEDWLADASKAGGPLVRFKVQGPEGSETAEQMLVDQDFGDEIAFGPIRIQLQRAANAAMLADFLTPPTAKPGSKGMLLAYHKGQTKLMEVDDSTGKRILLDGGIAVELVKYLPNAKPDMHGGFQSMVDSPANPMLELAIHMPGENQPLRQVAFAKNQLLNLDPIYGRDCPVKFRYYHPAIKPPTAIEFMQSEDGELFCRICAENRVTPKGKIAAGSRIAMPGNYVFAIVEHQTHVRQLISFEAATGEPSQNDGDDAAAEFEITAGGTTRTIWLQRNHQTLGTYALKTGEGPLQVRFSHGERNLDFSLKLLSVHRDGSPAGDEVASGSSTLRLRDEERGIDEEREITINDPLIHRGFTFCQSGFDDSGHGVKTSTLSVSHDPGLALKYGGSVLIGLGICIMTYVRAFKRVPDTQRSHLSWTRFPSATTNENTEPASDFLADRQSLTSTPVADQDV